MVLARLAASTGGRGLSYTTTDRWSPSWLEARECCRSQLRRLRVCEQLCVHMRMSMQHDKLSYDRSAREHAANAPRHPSKDHDARKGDSACIKATAGVFPNDKRTVSRPWGPGSPRGGGGGGHCQLSQQFGRMILRLQGEPAGEGVPASQDDVREVVPASAPLHESPVAPQSSSARWQVPWEPP